MVSPKTAFKIKNAKERLAKYTGPQTTLRVKDTENKNDFARNVSTKKLSKKDGRPEDRTKKTTFTKGMKLTLQRKKLTEANLDEVGGYGRTHGKNPGRQNSKAAGRYTEDEELVKTRKAEWLKKVKEKSDKDWKDKHSKKWEKKSETKPEAKNEEMSREDYPEAHAAWATKVRIAKQWREEAAARKKAKSKAHFRAQALKKKATPQNEGIQKLNRKVAASMTQDIKTDPDPGDWSDKSKGLMRRIGRKEKEGISRSMKKRNKAKSSVNEGYKRLQRQYNAVAKEKGKDSPEAKSSHVKRVVNYNLKIRRVRKKVAAYPPKDVADARQKAHNEKYPLGGSRNG